MKNKALLIFLGVLLSASVFAVEPGDERREEELTNWTFTYIKARGSQSVELKEYLESNWFVMDAKAVEQGLFKSYRLIENLGAGDAGERAWDYIVAVEYFGDQSYSDIVEEFEIIRSAHNTVLVDGQGFRELGSIVRSERVRFLD